MVTFLSFSPSLCLSFFLLPSFPSVCISYLHPSFFLGSLSLLSLFNLLPTVFFIL